jgi:repressor LexA
MVKLMVTPVQHKVYEFIRHYISEHGYSPSLAEVARGIGISPNSISLISRCIHALAAAGRLSFQGSGYRNIRVVPDDHCILPLIGRIAAGAPIEAIENKQAIDLDSLFSSHDHFILEVKGDSMKEEGILDGDLVICKSAHQANENEIVVALIDGQEATLKRLSYKPEHSITLIPANSSLQSTSYPRERVQIQGLFVGLLRLKK